MRELGCVEKLWKKYGLTVALRDVSFPLHSGLSLFLGPNGSGKSTCIKILSGLVKPSGGKVELLGLNPWNNRVTLMEKVGVALENHALPRWARGIDVLKHYARLQSLSEKDVEKSLKLFNIGGYAHRTVDGYSAGMRQKLVLTIAFLGEPELLILDEPTSDLDSAGKQRFFQLVDEKVRNGCSIILSTHFFAEMPLKADYAYFFQGGEVSKHGSLENISEELGLMKLVFKLENLDLAKTLSRLRSTPEIREVAIRGETVEVLTGNRSKTMEALKNLGVSQISQAYDYLRIYREAFKRQ
ncbi:MAG: ABC transporter ATP-binding protein [Thermoproteota archaeon]